MSEWIGKLKHIEKWGKNDSLTLFIGLLKCLKQNTITCVCMYVCMYLYILHTINCKVFYKY